MLDKDTLNLHLVSLHVQGLAKKHNADFVIVPYSCEIKHVTIRHVTIAPAPRSGAVR